MIFAQNFNSTSLLYQFDEIKLLGVLPWWIFFDIVHNLGALLEVFGQLRFLLFLFGQSQINFLHQLINMENFLIHFFQTFSLILILRPKEFDFASNLIYLRVDLLDLSFNFFQLLVCLISRSNYISILHLKDRLFKILISCFHIVYFLFIFVNQWVNILYSMKDLVLLLFSIFNLFQLQGESIFVQYQLLNSLEFTLDVVVLTICVLHLLKKCC